MDYKEQYKDPRWQKKRLEIMERDNWTCQKCSDTKTQLHVHHLKYHKTIWDTPNEFLITLCFHCHDIIEHLKEYKNLKDIPFNKIKIHGVKEWEDDKKVIFVRIGNILSLSIYDNMNFLIGFNMPEKEYVELKKLMYK